MPLGGRPLKDCFPEEESPNSLLATAYVVFLAQGSHNTEKENFSALALKSNQIGSYSIADELTKLIKLKEQGVLTGEEFDRIKKDLLDKKVK